MTIEERMQRIEDKLDELLSRVDPPDKSYSVKEVCESLCITRKKFLKLVRTNGLNIQTRRANGCNPVITSEQFSILRRCLKAISR